MILEPIIPQILSVRVIPDLDESLRKELGLKDNQRSIGMLTCTIDDALYTALDEGTKAADVEVIYAHSFYAGSEHASGPFSGEIIGVYAASDPDILSSGINAAVRYLESKAFFYSANEDNSLCFYPHVISQTGNYLSKEAGVEPGTPMAYLIAPPIEAILGLDAALKAADVSLKKYYPPPSETNFCGALLTGEIHQCEAAAEYFQKTVLELATNPVKYNLDSLYSKKAQSLEQKYLKNKKNISQAKYKLFESGFEIEKKPDMYTHLFDNYSLVRKDHPIIKLRGKLDLLGAYILDAQIAAREEGFLDLDSSLNSVLNFVRQLMKAEVTKGRCSSLNIDGFNSDELHKISHNTLGYLNVGFLMPDASMGKTVVKLNLLRAYIREVELAAIEIIDKSPDHIKSGTKGDYINNLNRLSNAVYVLTCKAVAALR